MAAVVKISIPSPCHKNWQDMTPADKGRFCDACQKNVIDFTNASDREIAAALKTGNACGRFRANQLDRDLIIPQEKNKIWMAASATAVALLTIGNTTLSAQTPVNTEQTNNKTDDIKPIASNGKRIVKGIISDDYAPIPGVIVMIKGKPETAVTSDIDGKYEIEVMNGETLACSYIGMEDIFVVINDKDDNYDVKLSENEAVYVGGITIHRTFFGRIFHSIGNIFR